MNNFKYYFFKILLLTIILIAVDFAVGLLFKNLFYKQKSGKYFTTTHAIKNATEDIAIFGNSHAAQHFNALLIQKKTGKTAFNFGNQGQGIFYVATIIKTMLAYHRPKLIILNVDYEELRYDKDDYARLSVFLPYFNTNAIIDSAITMSGEHENYKAYSSLYRYNSLLGYVLLNAYKPTYNKSMASLGFDPNDGTISAQDIAEANHPPVDTAFHFDRDKIRCLSNLVNAIRAQHVQLLVTTTPVYKYNNNRNLYKDKLKQLLLAKHADYLDDANDVKFQCQSQYFTDGSHLNTEGATLWTNECIKYIRDKQYLR